MFCARCHKEVNAQQQCPHCSCESRLDDRYELREHLGEGAHGATFRAFDTFEGREVAIKEVSLHRLEGWEPLRALEREAKALERISHPGVPRFSRSFQIEDGAYHLVYLVMDLVQGESLDQVGPFQEEEIFSLLEEMADVLIALEREGMVHRDIKPSNLLRRRDGSFVLVDFGTALMMQREGESTIAGTYGFIAPEQLEGRSHGASDIFSLGATVVALLRGTPARGLSASRDELLTLQCNPGLKALLLGMTESNVEERIRSGRELREALKWARFDEGLLKSLEEEPELEKEGEEPSRFRREVADVLSSFWAPVVGLILPYGLFLLLFIQGFTLAEALGDLTGFHGLTAFMNLTWGGNQLSFVLGVAVLSSFFLAYFAPNLERMLRKKPRWWARWRRRFRWRGLLQRRGNIRRKGPFFLLGRLSLSFVKALLAVVLFTVLYFALGQPLVPESVNAWVLNGLEYFFHPTILVLMGFDFWRSSRRLKRWHEGYLTNKEKVWGPEELGKLEEAQKSFLLADPSDEMLQRSREIRQELQEVATLKEQQRHLDLLRLLEVEPEEKEWRSTLSRIEREPYPREGQIRALFWVSEGLARTSEVLSERTYRSALVLEARRKRLLKESHHFEAQEILDEIPESEVEAHFDEFQRVDLEHLRKEELEGEKSQEECVVTGVER